MIEENESVFHQWVEAVWNEGKETAIDELFDENVVAEHPYNIENTTIYGKEEYKKYVRLIRALFTDMRVTIEQIASDENKVIALCTFTANRCSVETQVLAVHNPVKVSGLSQIIIEKGKIIRVWSNIDLFGITEPKKKGVSGQD